ncbi:MAG: L-lactate dehydrogenase [Eubacteriales bacterium]
MLSKCAIIGCGNVGAATAFTLVGSGLFSQLVLIDVNEKKAQGEAMDLNHGIPFATHMKVWAGTYDDVADCSVVIIAAGAGQKPGETRIDLLHRNAEIFASMIPEITRRNQSCILLVISNPVDILTYFTWKLSGFPAHRVMGSGTVLDTARLKYLLGERLGVDARNIHAFIMGEHGDSELVVWSSANVSGIDLRDFAQLVNVPMDSLTQLYDEVKNSAYRIIEGKGATYYGIARSVLRILQAIVRDEHTVLPVSTLAEGQYGLQGLCLGMPAIVGQRGVERVLSIPLDASEEQRLRESAEMLSGVLSGIHLEREG